MSSFHSLDTTSDRKARHHPTFSRRGERRQ